MNHMFFWLNENNIAEHTTTEQSSPNPVSQEVPSVVGHSLGLLTIATTGYAEAVDPPRDQTIFYFGCVCAIIPAKIDNIRQEVEKIIC